MTIPRTVTRGTGKTDVPVGRNRPTLVVCSVTWPTFEDSSGSRKKNLSVPLEAEYGPLALGRVRRRTSPDIKR
jgi:hypothetical protein